MRTIAGLVGGLLTPHGTDRYLELVNPMLVRDEIRGEVTEVRRQTADTVTLSLRPSRAWSGFTAGQYVRVSVDVDGVRRTRCYSPASSQHRTDGGLELTVKAGPDSVVSRHLRRNARRGTVVGLSEPDGEFTLPTARPERVLLVSGGSGITPVLAMLRTLVDEGYQGEIAFLHYASGPGDVLYREELERLGNRRNVRVAVVYTRAGSGHLSGHWSPEHLDTVAPWYRDAPTYLCGPQALRDAVGAYYASAKLSEQLHTEAFTPPALPSRSPGDVTGSVRFLRSGTEAPNTGTTLLEQAEAAGLTPEHGCRMGICFSCTQLKKSGIVRDVKTGAGSAEEDEEIQLCISVPEGDVELDC